MTAHSTHTLNLSPRFDMETFLTLGNESRLDGAAMQRLMDCWEAWQEGAQARLIELGEARYALVWLDEAIEREIDAAWKESPSTGFLLNVLAEMLVSELVAEIVPEVAEFGCAPVPEVSEALGAALADEGVPWGGAALGRRYAVLTGLPFAGGCEVCRLEPDGPTRRKVDAHTVVVGGLGPESGWGLR